MGKGNQSFKDAIKSHLDQRAKEDSLFAATYAKPNKSIDECCEYILGEARKRGNAVAISDEEVYGMAVHYYDEDDIKVNRQANYRVSTPSQPESEQKVTASKLNRPVSTKRRTKKGGESESLQFSLFEL